MSNNCDNVKFYATNETFGGKTPVDPCIPGVPRERPALERPNAELSAGKPTLTPNPIVIGNTRYEASCADMQPIPALGGSVVVDADVYTDTLALTDFTEIPTAILNKIAAEHIAEKITERYRTENVSPEWVSELTGLSVPVATRIVDAMRVYREDLNNTAKEMAASQLNCFWLNNTQTAYCTKPGTEEEDPDVAQEGEYKGARPKVVVAAGTFKSYISQSMADTEAMQYATSQLNCLYINDYIVRTCQDRPENPEGATEEVPNDSKPLRPNLKARRGKVTVDKGTFMSVVSKSDAMRQAETFALSQLVCYYVNDPVHRECADPEARNYGVNPNEANSVKANVTIGTKGQYVDVPRAFFQDDTSSAAATEKAINLAKSLLECCYINDPVHVECAEVELTDRNGDVVMTADGKPVTIGANKYLSPVYSVDIAPGTFAGCESKEVLNQMAYNQAISQLECVYCNTKVLPTCVPDWVVQAADSGIPAVDAEGKPYIFKLQLPINPYKLITNPVTGESITLAEWSKDATVGVQEDTFCAARLEDAQGLAAITPNDNLEEGSPCEYTNRTTVAGCSIQGIDVPTSRKWSENIGNYVEYGNYRVIPPVPATVDELVALDENYKAKVGTKAIPEQRMSLSEGPVTVNSIKYKSGEDDVCIPGDTVTAHWMYSPSKEVYYSYIKREYMPDGTLKAEYPVYRWALSESLSFPKLGQAIIVASDTISVSDRDVQGTQYESNPKEYANAIAETLSKSLVKCIFGNRRMLVTCEGKFRKDLRFLLENDEWNVGLGKPTDHMLEGSNNNSNPIVIAPDVFQSTHDLTDAFDQAYAFALSVIQCKYYNTAVEKDCYGNTVRTGGVVPERTFTGDSYEEAQAMAEAFAAQTLVCLDFSAIAAGATGPSGAPGPEGPPGRDGKDGTSAKCSEGSCYGVYS